MPAAAAPAPSLTLGVATLCCWLFTAGVGGYMLRRVAARGGLRAQRAVRDGLHPGVLVGHFSLALTGLLSWICFLLTGWAPLAWLGVVLLMPAIGFGICTVTLWTPYPRSPAAASGGSAPVTAVAAADPDGTGAPPDGPGAPPGGPPTGPDDEAAARYPLLPAPPPDAVRGRLTDAMLVQALTDDALAARLIDDVIASLPAHSPLAARKRRAYPVAVIPFGHGLGAVATFVLAVMSAIGAR
jgi:hypothetical protein